MRSGICRSSTRWGLVGVGGVKALSGLCSMKPDVEALHNGIYVGVLFDKA